MEFRKILVRATNWVGDAVMSLPALQALRKRFPAAHIAIWARPWVADLYAREPFCDELIAYRAPNGWRGLGEKWRVAAQLRERGFDCAILLQNAFEPAAIVRAARIPVRIGYQRDARGWLLTHSIAVPLRGETPPHQRFYYLELLKRSGLIADYREDSPIRLAGASVAATKGRQRYESLSIFGPIVGVSPGAAYGGAKRWLPERFAEAAAQIARERNATVAVFGSKEEIAICGLVEREVKALGIGCVNFAGATALGEFIEMAAACDIFLTNDSGPMHLAAAMGLPTVVIFGATDEHATGPTGESSQVVREPVECSPCLLRECPIDHRCMTRVSSERVAETALRLLNVEKRERVH